jgi:tRNA (cytidine/uridine-2'-O-)-methyltransferase
MVALALFQPDIPQNVGAMMRLTACLGVRLEIIEPCGFPWDDRKIKQSALDYSDAGQITRHASWDSFKLAHGARRIILMSTKTDHAYTDFTFRPDDILLAGRESAGVPENIHQSVNARITIPLKPGLRSLNISIASAMVLGEALRQTGWTK